MASRETRLSADSLGGLEALTEDEVAQRESENGVRQFNQMVALIRQALAPGVRFRLRPSMISSLNAISVDGLEQSPGAYRASPAEIVGSKHKPPPWPDIPLLVDDLCDYVNDSWEESSALHVAAYCMWRINWIHPFVNGNGRTSRAVSYVVLCAHLRSLLPGHPTLPELIANEKVPYYRALEHADGILLRKKTIDVSKMETLMEGYLARQLVSAIDEASTQTPADDSPPSA